MMKKLVLFFLAAVLAIGSLTACTQDDQSVQQPEQNEQPQENTSQEPLEEEEPVFVYHAEINALTLDDAYQVENIGAVCASGTEIYFTADCLTDAQPVTDPLYDELYGGVSSVGRVFHLNPETKQITCLEGYTPYVIEDGWGGYVSLNGIFAGKDGSVWVNELVTSFRYNLPEDFDAGEDDPGLYYEAGLRMNRLIQLDNAGQILKQIELIPTADQDFSGIVADSQGYIYASAWDEVQVYDTNGTYVGMIDLQGNSGELLRLNENMVGIRCWLNGSAAFLPFDLTNMTVSTPVMMRSTYAQLIPGNGTYQYVTNIGGVLYGHMEGAETDEKILSLLDCDVNSSTVIGCMYLSDGRLAALEKDAASGGYNLVLIELNDLAELPQKQTLTLGTVGVTEVLRSYVVDFNRTNDDVHIAVSDYSEYNTDDDFTLGLTTLKNEILSGLAPDIIYVDSQLSIDQFGAKGKFLNLWPMIDNDETLSRDDLMTHFFDVLATDGMLYQVTDSFTIQTAAGLQSAVGDGSSWTADTLQTAMTAMEDGATVFGASDTAASVLTNLLPLCMDQFITWTESGAVCSFDSDAFLDILEFAFTSGTSNDGGIWGTSGMDHLRMRAGLQLLKHAGLYDFNQIRYNELELGEAIAYVGYPVENGSWFNASGGWAISASCESPELAWRFVRTCLTEEYQSTISRSAFPSNRHVFEAMVQNAMEPASIDPNSGETAEYDEIYWANNAAYIVLPLTQAQYETVMNAYESCAAVAVQDSDVASIIMQEAAAYFSGEKSAEEAAACIQELVSALLQ